jgi:hypothetical protein
MVSKVGFTPLEAGCAKDFVEAFVFGHLGNFGRAGDNGCADAFFYLARLCDSGGFAHVGNAGPFSENVRVSVREHLSLLVSVFALEPSSAMT